MAKAYIYIYIYIGLGLQKQSENQSFHLSFNFGCKTIKQNEFTFSWKLIKTPEWGLVSSSKGSVF